MSEQMAERDQQDEHLRGKNQRGAEDAGHGTPRPDEEPTASERPPGVQATHAGMPTDTPLAEHMDESGVGRDANVSGAGAGADEGRSRYTGHGRETEGAFGEEEPR